MSATWACWVMKGLMTAGGQGASVDDPWMSCEVLMPPVAEAGNVPENWVSVRGRVGVVQVMWEVGRDPKG